MKNILAAVISISLIILISCNGHDSAVTTLVKTDTTYAIIGKVTGQDSGVIYLLHRQTGVMDSARLDHGYFKFNGKADTAEFCRIGLNNQSAGFFLENGKIAMLIKKDSLSSAIISGTKTQDEYNYYQNTFSKELNDRSFAIDNAYASAVTKKNQSQIDSLLKIYELIDADQKKLAVEYIRLHPGSVVSAYVIYSNYSYNPPVAKLDSLYKMLDSSIRIGYYGRKIAYTVEKEKLTRVGNPAPDFTNNDVNGQPISLSSFKGRYTLIDFWASWCGPCRQENPNVVKAYHKFHSKGFDILGVSLDRDKVKWRAAIKKDGLKWTQVSDLKGWKADVVVLYGVEGIPMNYLIDKNGIIVAKGLRGDELDKKLGEIFH